jgi:hypothetical protein
MRKQMNNFGIFYTCYKEIKAVDYSIKVLKEIYPDCPIYLVSDGGDDYSFLETKYKNIKTKISYDSRGISQALTKQKWMDPLVRMKVLESVNEFFKRNLEAIEYCNTESMLIMEPDVLVRGMITTFPSKENALLGTRVNKPDHDEFFKMINILKEISGSVEPTHYGSTPAFYNTETMKKISNFVFNNQNIIKKLVDTDPAFVCYDVFLTVLFAACGYHEVKNSDVIECYRDSNWPNTHHPILHQFRLHYPKKNTGYTGRHANDL